MLLRTLLQRNLTSCNKPVDPLRCFSISSYLTDKPLPPRLKINDADLTVSYLKGTGPGGQKINKTNSAVQLIHKPTGIVVKSQATRSRSQNEKIARQLLADKVEQLEKGDQSRTAIKADRTRKKKASKIKKSRRKYRELDNDELAKGGEELQERKEFDDGYLEPGNQGLAREVAKDSSG
ncbi:hypothetical protein BBP40_006245 [Aspergillus hancockii]|nr:hypothetical protein BBP40_006245 [Aspergillus hancockii]